MSDFHPFEDTRRESPGRWAGSLVVRAAAMSVELDDCHRTDGVMVSAHRFAVADGVDHVAGSGSRALEAVVRLLEFRQPAGSLHRALRSSNWDLWYRMGAPVSPSGLATITVALWSGYRFVIGHVGDSRAYLVRDGLALQITDDHRTTAQGGLSDEAVARLGQRPADWSADVIRLIPEPGDRLLLCTDGLWRCVTDAVIAEAVSGQLPAMACATLETCATFQATESASAVVVSVDLPGPGD